MDLWKLNWSRCLYLRMSYSSSTTHPRSVLVIVGGLIAWIGLIGGVLVTVPAYHRALTMKEEPVEMTWQELVDNGLTDNCHVRLVNVDLDCENPLGFFEDMLRDFDPTAPIENQEKAFELAAENMNFGDFADSILQPIKVFPKGRDANDVSASIVVPQSAWAMDAAYRQIEETGSLTGRFTLSESAGLEMDLAKLMIQQVAKAAEQSAAPSDADRPDAGITSDQGRQEDDTLQPEDAANPAPAVAVQNDDGPRYVFEPVDHVPSKADASQWFWFSGLAIALGLVICGSGGPSLSCCIFFQGPAILSLLGYPMRYRRAGRMTRIVYAATGSVLIYYGYQKMIVAGQFGQVGGSIPLAAIGFVTGAVGCGALLGSIVNAVAEKLNISLDPKCTQKNDERTMSFTEACSVEPNDADLAARYVDRNLVNTYNHHFDDSMQQIVESLAGIGFAEPEPVVWEEGEETKPALICLGCQEMVVADVDDSEGETRSRLVSVLHDGLAIVTLSANSPAEKPLRLGTNGLYAVADCNEPAGMLSTHLEQTVSMAEKRNTAVVQIELMEATDVALFGRRVVADVKAQYGEENMEVDSHRYGRFSFPAAPILQPSAV